jgi:hypothetical protein
MQKKDMNHQLLGKSHKLRKMIAVSMLFLTSFPLNTKVGVPAR